MIRLLVAAIVCVALQPAAATGAGARERTVVAASGGDHALPALDWHCDGVAAAGDCALAPVVWIATSGAAPRSIATVARLWLREQRLLC